MPPKGNAWQHTIFVVGLLRQPFLQHWNWLERRHWHLPFPAGSLNVEIFIRGLVNKIATGFTEIGALARGDLVKAGLLPAHAAVLQQQCRKPTSAPAPKARKKEDKERAPRGAGQVPNTGSAPAQRCVPANRAEPAHVGFEVLL